MLVASAVSVSGIIGFVGLIVPHCVRMLFGASHRRLLPASMVLGAMFMIFCDSISRTIIAPSEVPVGVITAVFGAPYFIFLLHKSGK
jgi:iron complex transport system permease protein